MTYSDISPEIQMTMKNESRDEAAELDDWRIGVSHSTRQSRGNLMRYQATLVFLFLSIFVSVAQGQTVVERLEEDDWMRRMTVDHRLEVYGTDVLGDAIESTLWRPRLYTD